MRGHLPHPATTIPDGVFAVKRGKKRGNYSCGRCGFPKKGHSCQLSKNEEEVPSVCTPGADTSTASASAVVSAKLDDSSPLSVARSLPPPMRRRALSFDDVTVAVSAEESKAEWVDDPDPNACSRVLPMTCMWEVLRRLPPSGLMSAAGVCKGWRHATQRIWRGTEELRLGVPAKAQIGFLGSVMQKCTGLVKLILRIESDFVATMLACIAFSCPNLQSMQIFTAHTSVNRISGEELSRFIADKRCLTSLKMEGCSNLGSFVFFSNTLSTLWLSDLHSLSKTAFNLPNLKEISLGFSQQENNNTDLTAVMDALGRSCPMLQNIHIASIRLSHAAVLSLTAANLRALRMLSLLLGSAITDGSVASICSSYPKLELLDLSGSSITDSGIGMICNVFPETLSKLLLALCPNITSSGIQFAAAQLPCLELLDCGMTICDPSSPNCTDEEDYDSSLHEKPNSKLHLVYQKLIIKHDRLKKLSLWGCSGLDALYLNCPHLKDLNLNSCRNLHPERLLLQCPELESVHASDCHDMLVKTIENQVNDSSHTIENHFPSKRMPDGSKRVQVPCFYSPQHFDDDKKRRMSVKRPCVVVAS
ncbi:F-box/LRR-repeat protein 17-like [Primulina eburnea]|uniref:F-box/LRR-repeat protein 17-like n=1 Tax=Primulina eburnea TaxID=1245227 RepID=UPI003C6C31D0